MKLVKNILAVIIILLCFFGPAIDSIAHQRCLNPVPENGMNHEDICGISCFHAIAFNTNYQHKIPFLAIPFVDHQITVALFDHILSIYKPPQN